MIFELHPFNDNKIKIIKPLHYSIDAWDMYLLMCETYPADNINLINHDGYENAISIIPHDTTSNQKQWENTIKRKYPTVKFERGHPNTFIFATVNCIDVGMYSIAGNYGKVHA